MKSLIDIHTVLSTPADMEDVHDNPDDASEKLNIALFMVYDGADEDIETNKLEQMLAKTWEYWHQDKYLSEIEVDDLLDWVDHLRSTWDDSQDDSF